MFDASSFNNANDNSEVILDETPAKITEVVGAIGFAILSIVAVWTILGVLVDLIFPFITLYLFSVFAYAFSVNAHKGGLTKSELVSLLIWPREAFRSARNRVR